MPVSVKTRVLLWGRAGGHCSFEGCGRELVEDSTATDDESLLGEIAHIVAESQDGPRGTSPLSPEQRDKYANLILLCKEHHKIIDDQVNTYTVEVLTAMKIVHESRTRAALAPEDLREQRDREIYATYLEHWQEAIHLDNWQGWTSWLLQAQPSLAAEAPDRFQALREWILSRVWPQRYPALEAAFINFSAILGDLSDAALRYGEREGDRVWMRKFYCDAYRDQSLSSAEIENDSARLLSEYEYHTDLIADLTLELTRAANYICDQGRQFVDPMYRMEQGILLVTSGMDMYLRTRTYRPEYRGEERVSVPYPGFEKFESAARATRDVNYGPRDSDRFDPGINFGAIE